MSGRGADRGSAGRGAKRKAPRVSAGGADAETYVESVGKGRTAPSQDLGELYVDEKPRRPKKDSASEARNGRSAARGASSRLSSSSSSAKKKASRAAERRRARGVPIGPEVGTSTALNQPKGMGQPGSESAQLPAAVGVLKCVKGPEEGLALNLLEGSYTVGRGRDNSFVLKDIASSRRHLRIDVEGGRVTVVDLGSGNGTRVNNRTVSEVELDEGDRIELGNSVLVFSRLGPRAPRAAPPSKPAVDDAQARIERAAEKLVAELGERYRDGGDEELEESDAAPTTTGLPRGRAKAEAERGRKRSRPPMPDELWNDALTHVPLSEVVPADAPLGQKDDSEDRPRAKKARTRRSAPVSPPLPAPPVDPPPARVPTPAKAAVPAVDPRVDVEPPALEPVVANGADAPPVPLPPRPPPATMPPTPADEPYVVAARPAPPTWTYVVLPALVVVLVLGTALGAWAFYRYVRDSGATPAEAMAGASAEYEQSVRLAFEAFSNKDLDTALVHAQRAYELRPNEVTVVALLQSIQDAKGQAASASPAEEEAVPTPAAEPPAPAPEASAAGIARPSAAPSEPPVEKPTEAAPQAMPARAPPAVEPPSAPKVAPKPAPVVRRQKPKPPPRPRAQQRRGMTDADAANRYRQAVRLIRDEDEAKGCAIMRQIAREAPASSNWKVKASHALGRYGCD